jgi:hypothetical protein
MDRQLGRSLVKKQDDVAGEVFHSCVGWIEDPTGTSSKALQCLEFGRVGYEFLQRIGGLLLGAIGCGHGWSSRGEGLKVGPGRFARNDFKINWH